MRSRRLILIPAILCLASLSADPVAAATGDEVYDIDMIVTLSGKCTAFRAAGQNLPCRAVKYFHGESGRAYYTVAIDDPADKGRIVSFTGDKARRDKNDFYELTIDQVMLVSRDRPLETS